VSDDRQRTARMSKSSKRRLERGEERIRPRPLPDGVSCRSPVTLAAGLPAIVHDTGFDAALPNRRRNRRFSTIDAGARPSRTRIPLRASRDGGAVHRRGVTFRCEAGVASLIDGGPERMPMRTRAGIAGVPAETARGGIGNADPCQCPRPGPARSTSVLHRPMPRTGIVGSTTTDPVK